MGAMASQITSLTIVYSTIYWGADQRKHQSSATLAFVWGIHRTGEFPAKMASNVITSSFTDHSTLLWKDQESIYTFKFNEIQRTDRQRLFTLLSGKSGMDILGFDRKLIKIAGQHIVHPLLYIINGSLFNGTFPDEWNFPEWLLHFKTTKT